MRRSTASSLARRAFVLRLGASLPFAVARRRSARQAAAALDRERLLALAEAVLPGEVGAAGVAAAVDGFARWLAGYREGVELLHGYGASEIRRTPPSPASRWAAQVVALDRTARRDHDRAFVDLAPAERRELIAAALAEDRTDALPRVVDARHVAVGLLAWWAETPGAADLCYRARIGRLLCRPLDAAPDRPHALGSGS
jgi:hypothetical protein